MILFHKSSSHKPTETTDDIRLHELLNSAAKNIRPSESLKADTKAMLDRRTAHHAEQNRSTFSLAKPRRMLITAAAIFVSCATLVSAAGIILDRLAYVPGIGIVNNENESFELYSTQNAIDWGITTIESVIRSKYTDPETGESNSRLTVYVTGVKPRGMYIMLTDGTRIDFREQGFTDKLFVCENFPDEDMFTLSVGYKHANITLKKADTEKYADIEWPTSNGITLTALPLSDNRNIFAVRSAYDPQLYVDIFGEELARSVKYSYPSASKITFTDKDGNEYFVDSGGSSEYSKSDERYTSGTRIIYADTGDNVGTEITKLTVGAFDERIDFGYINDKTPPLTAEVPLPGNGETIECEIPIITIDGDSYTITSVTRDDSAGNGHYLSFGMRIDDGSSKYDIRIYSLHLAPTDPELKKHFSSWGSSRNTEESDMYLGIGGVKKKNLTEYINTLEGRETITLGVYGLHAEMRGDWTIDFTEHKAAE